MKRCKQDEELANTNPQPFPSNEPSPETLEAIREGDAFLATGESGRFDNGTDLIDAALKAPEMFLPHTSGFGESLKPVLNSNSVPYTLLLFEYRYRPSDSVLNYR